MYQVSECLLVLICSFVPRKFDDDDRCPYSWLPSDDHAQEASELAERGPEAFPD